MTEFTLTAQKRTVVGKQVGQLRRSGMVPGTVYGPKLEPINVQFPYRILQLALMQAGGTNIIDLTIEGDRVVRVLARDVQRDVVRGDILHVDFFALDMKAKIRADIPLALVGENLLVQAKRAIIISGTNNLTVELLPTQLMQHIDVDISTLKEVGDVITVADLKLDPSIHIVNDPDEMIVKLMQSSAARAAESDEEDASSEVVMPEVIGRGKTEEDIED